MKLYFSPTSPYARKVAMTLHETGLLDRVEIVTVSTTPTAPDAALAAANPLGKLPCLTGADGPALFDSRVITRFLDSLHHGHRLYPAPPALWSTLTLEALADGVMDAAILAVYETRLRPEPIRFAPWVEGQKHKIAQALDALETLWAAHLAGPVDAGAIATAAALGYLDLRFGDMGWREGRPRLAAWHAGFAARPAYVATMPPA
jgi:glutathione S-transferase